MTDVDVYAVVDEFVDIYFVADEFDPNQPRKPKGSPEGGEWTSSTSPEDLTPEEWDAIKKELWGESTPAITPVETTRDTFSEGNLTSEEVQALKKYAGSGYNINNLLRKDPDSLDKGLDSFGHYPSYGKDHHKFIRELDSALQKGAAKDDAVVYRGWGNRRGPAIAALPVGTILQDQGYVSTSINKGTGGSFPGGYNQYAEITVPAGTSAMFLHSGLSNLSEEEEVLLPRETQFQITGHTQDGNTKVIRMRVVKPYRGPIVDSFDPNQPRKPKGSPEGGEWTSTGVPLGGISTSFESPAIMWGAIKLGAEDPSTLSPLNEWGPEDLTSRRPLTQKEIKSLNNYSRDGYYVNDHLRKNLDRLDYTAKGKTNYHNLIRNLDSAIQKSRSNKDTVVYRGWGKNHGAAIADLPIGTIVQDQGYSSTSLDRSIGRAFGGDQYTEINIPQGTHVLYMDDELSHHVGDEEEMLLPRETQFEITGHSKDEKDKTVVHMRVVKPYRGPIVDRQSVDAGFRPDEPRDPAGRWTKEEGWPGGVDPHAHESSSLKAWNQPGLIVGEQARKILMEKGIRPSELYHDYLGGQGGDLSVRHDPQMLMSLNLLGGNYGKFVFSRSLDPKYGLVNHDTFEVDESMQGTGIGKKILAGQMDLYDKMGIKQIHLDANIDVGSYAWAKYGFTPDQSSWDDLRKRISSSGAMTLMENLTPEEFSHAEALLSNSDPRSIWRLSDSTFAKSMLLDNYWHGVLNLDDPVAMARFNAYTRRR